MLLKGKNVLVIEDNENDMKICESHLKTAKGLSIKATIENKKKTDAILHYRERERAYRNMPVERRADKWAFNWLLKHPKQARYYQQMLELARNG